MKIAVGAMLCEGNSLTPVFTKFSDFDYAEGDAMLEKIAVTEMPIPKPLNRVVVMAMVEHRPKSCPRTGLLVRRPSFKLFLKFTAVPPSQILLHGLQPR